MTPQQLLQTAATLTANGDISLRDDPITHAWRTLNPNQDPSDDNEQIHRAAEHVSAILGIPHTDNWWLQLARRNTFQIAGLLHVAAQHAAPKQLGA